MIVSLRFIHNGGESVNGTHGDAARQYLEFCAGAVSDLRLFNARLSMTLRRVDIDLIRDFNTTDPIDLYFLKIDSTFNKQYTGDDFSELVTVIHERDFSSPHDPRTNSSFQMWNRFVSSYKPLFEQFKQFYADEKYN